MRGPGGAEDVSQIVVVLIWRLAREGAPDAPGRYLVETPDERHEVRDFSGVTWSPGPQIRAWARIPNTRGTS